MNRNSFLCFGLCLSLLFSEASHSALSKYDINCGIAQQAGDTFKIIKVSTNIPFVALNKDPNYYFGCTIKVLNTSKSANGEFTLYYELSPPSANLKTFTSNVGHTKTSSETELVIKSKPIIFSRTGNNKVGYMVFRLHDSDVPGKYSASIYINNKHEKTVVFNVSK